VKHLILIRHADAKPGQPGLCDFDRPLSRTGEREARATGMALLEKPPLPELIVCSDAVRTAHTASVIAGVLGLTESTIRREHTLYGGGFTALLYTIAALPDSHQCVALVGHNPAISELTGILTDGGTLIMMRTADAIRIDLPAGTWREATRQRGSLTRINR
jgi:phosphohistidine phosphatase